MKTIILISSLILLNFSCGQTESTNGTKPKTIANVECKSTEIVTDPEYYPLTLDSCSYKNIVTTKYGTPDDRERYSYSYKVFIDIGDSLKQLKNHQLFNDNLLALEDSLNRVVKIKFDELKALPTDCFKDFEPRYYKIDDFGLSFEDDYIIFNLTFGFEGACLAVEGINVKIRLQDMDKYWN